MGILKKIGHSGQPLFLIFAAFLFFILRLPSLFEPLWYGDEGIYQVIGTSLNHGKLLYSEIFDNKPPLLYWTYALLHSDQFAIRLISLVFGVFCIILFFFLSKKLFKSAGSNKIAYLTTIFFAILFGLPMLEGNIANAENFMLLPIIASALLVINQKKFFLAGLLLGLAFLFKIVAIFDLSAFLVFCIILNSDSFKKKLKVTAIIAGFLLPILSVCLYFATNGTFIDFMKATFISNISYVSYGNRIGSAPILLFIKLIFLVIFIFFLFTKRKVIGRSSLFVLIWFAFSLFNTFFSQRPYTHYLLVLIPSFSLLMGLILFEKKHQKFIILIFLIAIIVVVRGFGAPNIIRNLNYYQNFISYILNKKTTTSYEKFFDHNTPLDYEIARIIRPDLAKNDTIFVWGNNPQLYQLVGVIAPTKYVVEYHISGYKDGFTNTQMSLEKIKPKFIVIMSSTGTIPFNLAEYSEKINIGNSSIYERIF
jgi:4-amino-4-deoxy-L-arabinose transferase-like glycosyltransferase